MPPDPPNTPPDPPAERRPDKTCPACLRVIAWNKIVQHIADRHPEVSRL